MKLNLPHYHIAAQHAMWCRMNGCAASHYMDFISRHFKECGEKEMLQAWRDTAE